MQFINCCHFLGVGEIILAIKISIVYFFLHFLCRDCNIALACLASHMIPLAVLPTAVDTIESISASPSWKARNAILEFLQVSRELSIETTAFLLPPSQRFVCSTTWPPFIPSQIRLLECVLLLQGDNKTQSYSIYPL